MGIQQPRLQRLRGLVDEYRLVGQVTDGPIAGAYQGAGYHLYLVQQILGDVALQLVGLGEELAGLLLQHPALFALFPAKLPGLLARQLTILLGGLAHRAQLVVVFMRHYLRVERVL